MTIVKVIKNDKEFVLEIKGHSGYADKGNDIVCSSISSMSLMLVEYLNRTYGIMEIDESDGSLYCKTRKIMDGHTLELLGAYSSMMKQLVEQYPNNVRYEVITK